MMRPTLSAMNVGSLVRRARGSNDWRIARERLAQAIRRKPSAALNLAKALDDDLSRHGYDIAISALRHDAFELACQSPGEEATPVAIQLGARPPMQHPNYPRPEYLRLRNAMQVAGTRPSREIKQALDRDENLRHEDPEFGLLLTHELVLRGAEPSPGAGWYSDWAARTNHPLARLPLQLLEIEREMPTGLPQYPGALGASSWPTTSEETPDEYLPLGELLRGIAPGVPLAVDEVLTPFQDWLDHSNGRVQVAGYRLSSSFAAGLPDPQIHAERPATLMPPSRALRSIFIAASGGGAYSPSPGGATARLQVWTSLTALMDVPAGTPIDQVAKAAGDARWIRLAPDDVWFDDVAWDVWMIVDDGHRVISVAATDTD
jgi:hypothetical protein